MKIIIIDDISYRRWRMKMLVRAMAGRCVEDWRRIRTERICDRLTWLCEAWAAWPGRRSQHHQQQIFHPPLLSSPLVPTVSHHAVLLLLAPAFLSRVEIFFSSLSTVKCVGFVGHCITRLFKWDNTRDNIVKLENFAKTRNKIKWELLPAGRPVSGCYETIKIITPGKMTSLKWETELNLR